MEENLNLNASIEAILFTVGDSVSIEKLCEVTNASLEEIENAISYLMDKYSDDNSGLDIIRLENNVQMCAKSNYYELLKALLVNQKERPLSDTALETLSIIAYKQPVTRMEIEKIRGVDCSRAVNRLIEIGLVTELGRMNAPGRPLLFGTTEEFLRAFGVSSLEDLPMISGEKSADFEAEAEREVEIELKI